MKKILLIIIFASLFANFVAADVISPGEKGVSYCFEIENINEYPNYTFFGKFSLSDYYKELNDGDCISFYKFDSPIIIAIPNEHYDPLQINEEVDGMKKYIEANEYVVTATDVEIKPISTVPKADPTQKVKDVLVINNLSEEEFILVKSKAIYTYEDGSTEEVLYITQENRPVASKSKTLSSTARTIWFFIIPIAAIALIFLIVVVRKYLK